MRNMLIPIFKWFCLTLFLLGSIHATATDYYVNPVTGDDNEYTHGTDPSTPWKTIKFASTKIPAGNHTVHLSAGTHVVSNAAWFKDGISVIGAGKESTTITGTGDILVFRSDNLTDGSHELAHFTIDGQESLSAKGIVVYGRSNVHVHDIKFLDCRFTGLEVIAKVPNPYTTPLPYYLTGIEIHDNEFINSARLFSWGSGGSATIGGVDGMQFYNNHIIVESGVNGYGLKFGATGKWKNCKVYNNVIETSTVVGGPWPGEGFSIEVFNLYGGNEIYNNTVSGPISLIANDDRGNSQYTVRLHHNVYYSPTGAPDFAVECIGKYIEIDNNLFVNPGKEGIVMWPTGQEWMPAVKGNHKIYNNAFLSTVSSFQAGISMNTWNGNNRSGNGAAESLENVEIYNNTFKDLDRALFLNASSNPDCEIKNIDHKNNIMIGMKQAAVAFCCSSGNGPNFQNIALENNLYYDNAQNMVNWGDLPSSQNLNQSSEINGLEPMISYNGDVLVDWKAYFALQQGSPAIDAGQMLGLGYQGNAPDIGAVESAFSISTTAPDAPSNLSSSDQTDPIRVNLSWSDNSDNEFGFKVERRIGSSAFSEIATVGANITSYSDENVAPSTTYEYRVRAYNNNGNSGYSNITSETTPACQSANLSAPSGLSATSAGEAAIDLSWNTYTDPRFTGFNLYRSTSSTGNYTQVNSSILTGTSYTDNGLQAGNTYYYKVAAVDDCPSDGTLSSAVSATTLSQDPFPGPNPHAIPGIINVEDFDQGGQGVAYYDNTAGNTGGSSYRSSDVDIWDGGGSDRVIGWIANGEWLEYTVEASSTGNFDVILNASNPNAGQVSVWVDGTNVSGTVSLASTSDYSTYVDNNLVTVNLSTGVHIIRLQMEAENFNINTLELNNGTTVSAPNAPSSLSASAQSSSAIDLSWNDNSSNEQGFRIERKQGSGSYSEVATVGPGVTSYSDNNLNSSTTYTYRVRAYNTGGNSSYSNESSATTQSDTVAVTGVSLSPSSLSLNVGSTQQLTATILPSNATDQTVNWSSSNTTVAMVDGNGLVSAIAEGTATITVTTTDGGFTATSSITVSTTSGLPLTFGNSGTPGTGQPWSLDANGSITIEAENFNQGGSGIAYHDNSAGNSGSSNYRPGTDVDMQGTSDTGGGINIGWIAAGEWLEYTVNVPQTGTYDINLRVAGNSSGSISVSFGPASNNLTNVTGTLNVPNTGGWQAWTTVSASGISLSAGEQIMRINMESSGYNLNWIQVAGSSSSPVAVTGVTLSSDLNLMEGATGQLAASVSPANADDKSVSYSSSNTSVATVDNNGLVTALSAGTATITVTTNDGGFTDQVIITVTQSTVSVTGVTLTPDLNLPVGATGQLTATVSPSNADDPSVIFSSDNTAVATVNSSGLVTAIASGTAIVSVTTNDGGFTDQITVTVQEQQSGPCTNPVLLDKSGWSATASVDDCNNVFRVLDGNYKSSYQSCDPQVSGMYIDVDMGQVNTLTSIDVSAHNGNDLAQGYDIQLSVDGVSFNSVGTETSPSGDDVFNFSATDARYIRVINTGDYWTNWQVQEIDGFGCDGASAGRIAKVTNISVENIQNEIQVYPNPASEILIISSAELINRLILFDAVGKDIAVSFDGKSIDISHLQAGFYILKLEVSGYTIEKRIVIR